MTSKIVKIGDKARKPMIEGVNILADAVGATMGPGGRLVAMRRSFGPVMVTKDGVTVANEIDLTDPYQDAGAKLCKQVAKKCNEQTGDGTTTSTVLAREIINLGDAVIQEGLNPVSIKKGIDLAVNVVVEHLNNIKKPITLENEEEVKFIATISGNDEEVGTFVSEAFVRAGKDGVVTFEEGKTTKTELTLVDGTQFDKGFVSPYFVTDKEKNQCILENPRILLWEKRITSLEEIVTFLQQVKTGDPLLIIADSVDGDALATLIVNHMRGVIQVCVVTPPSFGEQRQLLMGDLAALVDTTYFSEAGGHKLENVTADKLGEADRVIITPGSTTIINGRGATKPAFTERVQSLRMQLQESDSPYDTDKLQQRLAKLSGGVALIKIGAQNETEMREKKFRYEDAVFATRAALEEGIVPGGGAALLSCRDKVRDLISSYQDSAHNLPGSNAVKEGMEIVYKTLSVPTNLISSNAGFDGTEVVTQVETQSSEGYGFNAATGQYVDMIKEGIVDPVKVTRLAVQNAATIAGLFLLSEALITDDPESNQANPMAGMM